MKKQHDQNKDDVLDKAFTSDIGNIIREYAKPTYEKWLDRGLISDVEFHLAWVDNSPIFTKIWVNDKDNRMLMQYYYPNSEDDNNDNFSKSLGEEPEFMSYIYVYYDSNDWRTSMNLRMIDVSKDMETWNVIPIRYH